MPSKDRKRKRSVSSSSSSSSSSSVSVNTSLSSSSSDSSSDGGKAKKRASRRSPTKKKRSVSRDRNAKHRGGDDRKVSDRPAAADRKADVVPQPQAHSKTGVAPATNTTQAQPAAAAAAKLSSANVRTLGSTKADGKKPSDADEVAQYLKGAKERVSAWDSAHPPANVVTSEVQRLLSERFTKGVSQRSMDLLVSVLDEIVCSAKQMTEVIDVLSQRLAQSYEQWKAGAAVTSSSARRKLGQPLLHDWYIIDGVLKHYKRRAVRDAKAQKAATENGVPAPASSASLADTLLGAVLVEMPALMKFLPNAADAERDPSDKTKYQAMVATWKHVITREQYTAAKAAVA